MKRIALMLTTLLLMASPLFSKNSPTDLPNMIIFLTDDQGYGDLGCYGHPEIKSPHLDRFAAQGVLFTQGYAPCGVCSPSRSAILTGRTPYRNGVWRYCSDIVDTDVHLKTSEITIATLLKQRGYNTCHAGKWHLNSKFNSPEQPQPNDHGYDRVIDGVNMLPALKGEELEREQPLYWRTHVSNLDCRVALREGDWKIVADYKMEEFLLFNMADDCKEEHDLSERFPERFADLREKLIAHDRVVRTEGGTLDVPERVQ